MTDRLDLPEPVAAYFAATKSDTDAVDRLFTQDAVVKDEGHTHVGLAAVKLWKASGQFTYTSHPFAAEQRDGMTIVASHLTGNFPGSPIDLRFYFRLERGKIAFLEIIP
jgi:SnoaL-like domain